MSRAPRKATREDPDHPGTPGHLATCEPCQDTLLYYCAQGDHRLCHLDPVLECEVSERWLEPVREGARAALAKRGQPGLVAVVSRPAGVGEREPTVHGVARRGAAVRRVFWTRSGGWGWTPNWRCTVACSMSTRTTTCCRCGEADDGPLSPTPTPQEPHEMPKNGP